MDGTRSADGSLTVLAAGIVAVILNLILPEESLEDVQEDTLDNDNAAVELVEREDGMADGREEKS